MSLFNGAIVSTATPEWIKTSREEVLIAEDDPMFRKILQSSLTSWGYKVVVAEDGAKAWEILQREEPPELLIFDWDMPEINGLELCRRVRQWQRSFYQYILLVTAKGSKQDIVRGLETGADDYLTKPFDQSELRARLKVGRRILALQEKLIQTSEELRFQATHDPLMGIWNRGALMELLSKEFVRAARSHSSIGVLMLDVDHFKEINDRHGHLAGDEVLREMARRVTQALRPYDFVGRYGGEELLVVLPDCDKVEAQSCAERIRSAIAGASIPNHADGSAIRVTISIGATAVASDSTAQQSLAIADTALYQAKREGRNCVVAV